MVASAAGVSLGAVVGVVEQGASPQAEQTDARTAPAAPIEPGTQDIQAIVVVTFAVA